MLHIIQENLFREVHYDNLTKSLDRLDIPYKIVRIYPFVDWVVDIDDIPENYYLIDECVTKLPQIEPIGEVWCWGSLAMTRICNERGWAPGTMINDNHNYEVYSKWWGDNLLNSDSLLMKISDELPWDRGDLFLRPVKDSKAFTGAVFNEERWQSMKSNMLDTSDFPEFNKDTIIQVSSPKNIQFEVRVWIVKGEIATASYYRRGNEFYISRDVDEYILDYAREIIKLGQLADAWVLDVCMSNNEMKIVEAGCINHAGFYDSDLQKTIESIERNHEKFEKRI